MYGAGSSADGYCDWLWSLSDPLLTADCWLKPEVVWLGCHGCVCASPMLTSAFSLLESSLCILQAEA